MDLSLLRSTEVHSIDVEENDIIKVNINVTSVFISLSKLLVYLLSTLIHRACDIAFALSRYCVCSFDVIAQLDRKIVVFVHIAERCITVLNIYGKF